MSAANPNSIDVSPEITAAAEKMGVRFELPHVLAMTQTVFPGDAVRVEIDDDPDLPNDRHLAIVVHTKLNTVDELVATQWAWHERLFGCCPAPLAPVFRLATETAS